MNPATLWQVSGRLHRSGFRRTARLLKALNFLWFRAVLPPEALVGAGFELGHWGLGVVVHPNVTIGDNVRLWHAVTLAVQASVGSDARICIGDNVSIGAHSVVLSRRGESLSIGEGAVVGAGSVVVSDVPARSVVVGNPARVVGLVEDHEKYR